MHFDEGFDSLKKSLSKDLILKDYGGDGPSLEELSSKDDVPRLAIQHS